MSLRTPGERNAKFSEKSFGFEIFGRPRNSAREMPYISFQRNEATL
jgi:hypothetical protein